MKKSIMILLSCLLLAVIVVPQNISDCNCVSLNRTYTSNYYDWDDPTQIIVIEQ